MGKLPPPPGPKVAKGFLTAKSHASIEGLDLRDIVNVKSKDSVYTYKYSHAKILWGIQQTQGLGKAVTL